MGKDFEGPNQSCMHYHDITCIDHAFHGCDKNLSLDYQPYCLVCLETGSLSVSTFLVNWGLPREG